MLGNYLQQTNTADVIFQMHFFSWRFKGLTDKIMLMYIYGDFVYLDPFGDSSIVFHFRWTWYGWQKLGRRLLLECSLMSVTCSSQHHCKHRCKANIDLNLIIFEP